MFKKQTKKNHTINCACNFLLTVKIKINITLRFKILLKKHALFLFKDDKLCLELLVQRLQSVNVNPFNWSLITIFC